MTHFMAYVGLVSAGIGACAVVVELLLRSRTRTTRWVWVTALGMVLLAAGIAAVAPAPVEIEVATSTARPLVADGITAPPITIAVDRPGTGSILRVADVALPVIWAVVSFILVCAILAGRRRLTFARRSAEPMSLKGRDVLLTENLGPAVAGIARPIVFVPRWVLALDAQSQELLLTHEFEHVNRGDTRLLLAGACTAALMPWNPVVWWVTRRLRLAVEQDCDARVLSRYPDIRRYADLLLTAASRPSVYASLLAAHFGEHRSDLGRRIQAMTDRTHDWQRILATAAVATVLIVASCEAPRPEPLAPRTSGSPAIVQPDETTLDESQVEKPVMLESGTEMPKYPEILRRAGVEGEVLVSFVVNEQGTVEAETFKVIRSTHELFATAVKKALAGMRFAAAEAGGRKVKQVVEQPFSFSLPGLDRKSEGVEEVVKAGGKRLAFAVRRGRGAAASWEEKQVPSTIILRGAHPRDLSASPLLIVDGVIIKGEMKEIDPEMIESVEVVKGAAALSAYGAGAQNGVIRITTKARRRVP